MKSSIRNTQVSGIEFEVYSDFIARGTFATNKATGEIRQISFSGYIRNDLTVRKAIANSFRLPTFRAR